jgi:hypothetical protein
MDRYKARSEKIIFLCISIIVWLYLWLRAYYVQPIYDEIATFFHYIHTGDFLPFLSHPDANNHLLNSFLTWLCYRMFGTDELDLRLPNLLLFILYAVYTFRLASELRNRWLRWSLIIALLFVHSLLEFFAMTRGYGMSMAFTLAGCYHLFKFFRSGSHRQYLLTALFMFLAVCANLNLLYTYLIILIITTFYLLTSIKRNSPLSSLLSPLSFLLPALFFILFLLQMKQQGLLYYGSTDGFWEVSAQSLVKMLFGGNPVILYYTAFLFITALALWLILVLKQRKFSSFSNEGFVFFYLVIGNILAALLGNLLMGINYHEARTALYLYPLLILGVVFILDEFLITHRSNYLIIMVLPFLLIPAHFILHVNLSGVSIENERVPERFLLKVKEHTGAQMYPATIGGYRGREMQWAWLNYQNGGNMGMVQSSDYPGDLAGFQIIDINIRPDLRYTYDSLDFDKQTGFYLLQKKFPPALMQIARFPVDSLTDWTQQEYQMLGQLETDTLAGKSLYAGYRFSLISRHNPLKAWVVFCVFDKDRNTLCYERIPLDWLRDTWDDPEDPFINGLYISNIPENASKFVTYIWNIEKEPFRTEGGSCCFFELKE